MRPETLHVNRPIGIRSEKPRCERPRKTMDRQSDWLILLNWAKSAIKSMKPQSLNSGSAVLIYGALLPLDVLIRSGTGFAECMSLLNSQPCSPLPEKVIEPPGKDRKGGFR